MAGCGETSTTPQVAANATTPQISTSSTTPDAASTTGGATSVPPPSVTNAGHQPSARAKALKRKAFSSLAHAKPAPKLAPGQHASLAVDDIELTSPEVHIQTGAPATIARQNTCNGKDQSPALNWKNIPPGTAELAIFIISTTPVNNKLFYDWAVAGINPHLHGISQGQTPPGAVTGRNSGGQMNYSLCPPTGKDETYLIAIYALPNKLAAAPGFEPAELRKQATHAAHHSGLLVGSYRDNT